MSYVDNIYYEASQKISKKIKIKNRSVDDVIRDVIFLISCYYAYKRNDSSSIKSCIRKFSSHGDFISFLKHDVIKVLKQALDYRYKVIEALASFEYHAFSKKRIVEIYIRKYGFGRFKFKNFRGKIFLVYERYRDNKNIFVNDPEIIDVMRKYFENKNILKKSIEKYESFLDKLIEIQEPVSMKIAKVLKREVKDFRRRIRKLSSHSSEMNIFLSFFEKKLER